MEENLLPLSLRCGWLLFLLHRGPFFGLVRFGKAHNLFFHHRHKLAGLCLRSFCPCNKDKIPPLPNLWLHLRKGRADDALAAIAADGLADLFGGGDANPVAAKAVFAGIGDNERMDCTASFKIKAPEFLIQL